MNKGKSPNGFSPPRDFRRVYLNNAAGTFPLAPGVTEAVMSAMEGPPQDPGRGGGEDVLEKCRTNAAKLLDVAAKQIVLCSGATHALNMAILGLSLKPGDVVISSVMEHNSVLRPLARLEDLSHINLRLVPLNKRFGLNTAVYEKLLREKPRLVILTNGSNVTGRINPIAGLFAQAKEAGALTLLDAAQSIGHIPVHPRNLHADMTAFSGYKGLGGPRGTGILYVSPEVTLEPVLAGGTGVQSDLRLQPGEMPLRLEAGTPNTPGFAGLNAALEHYLENSGAIGEAERNITGRLISALRAAGKGKLCIYDCEEQLPVVSFTIPGLDCADAGFILAESFGVSCRTGLHCAPRIHEYLGSLPGGTIRFSPSWMTRAEDIDYAADAVKRSAML